MKWAIHFSKISSNTREYKQSNILKLYGAPRKSHKAYTCKNGSTERSDLSGEIASTQFGGEGAMIEKEVKTHQRFLGIKFLLHWDRCSCIGRCTKQTLARLAFVRLSKEEEKGNIKTLSFQINRLQSLLSTPKRLVGRLSLKSIIWKDLRLRKILAERTRHLEGCKIFLVTELQSRTVSELTDCKFLNHKTSKILHFH